MTKLTVKCDNHSPFKPSMPTASKCLSYEGKKLIIVNAVKRKLKNGVELEQIQIVMVILTVSL